MILASQVLYINNVCLMPKLEYVLQNTFLTKKECEIVQQPYVMTAKNKMGLPQTIANHVVLHSRILNMRALGQTLKTKQMLSLLNRLNSKGEAKKITEIRIRQGQIIVGGTDSIWLERIGEIEKKLIRNNLACQVIQDNIQAGLEIIPREKTWAIKGKGNLIKNLISNKIFINVAEMLQTLDIIMLEQLLDTEESQLII